MVKQNKNGISSFSDILELILDTFIIHEMLINQLGNLSQLNEFAELKILLSVYVVHNIRFNISATNMSWKVQSRIS